MGFTKISNGLGLSNGANRRQRENDERQVETWVGERAELELVATWDREKVFKVASVDKAMEMGINWWQSDSYLTPKPKEAE